MSEPRFLSALLLDVGVLIALLILGWLVASRVDPGGSRLFAAALAFPLGSGLLTLSIFVLSLLGVSLGIGMTVAVLGTAILVLGSSGAYLASKRPSPTASAARRVETRGKRWELPALMAIAILCAVSIAVSIGRSYSTWDAAAIWGVKGYGIARAGTIWAASDWGAYGLSYPLNIPLLVSVFAMLDGDIVPGSKLIFPLYYASLALGLLAHLRQRGAIVGTWAAAFVVALPIVFDHATQGYANLPFATYIVLGTLLAAEAASSGRRGPAALSGMAFGFGVWTRPEGLPLVAAAYAALLLGAAAGGLRWKPGWEWFLPCVLIGGGWLAFSVGKGAASPLDNVIQSAAASLSAGKPNLIGLYWIGRYLVRDALRPSVWGMLVPAVVIGAVLHWRKSRLKAEARDTMILATAVTTGGLVLGYYLLVSFTGNLEWWLDTGLSRMLLPSALLLAVWAVAPWLESRQAA